MQAGLVLAGAAAGALATALLGKLPGRRRAGGAKPHKQVFVLIVTVTFKTSEDREKAIELWRPLAAHVAACEPRTLSYEAVRCDRDDTKLLFLERYTDKEQAYQEVHRSSRPYTAFVQQLTAHAEVQFKDGVSGFETNIGYV